MSQDNDGIVGRWTWMFLERTLAQTGASIRSVQYKYIILVQDGELLEVTARWSGDAQKLSIETDTWVTISGELDKHT